MLAMCVYLSIIEDIPIDLYEEDFICFFIRSLIYISALLPSLIMLIFDILISPIEIIIAIVYLIKKIKRR